ncbi:hypothetical protein NDU88_009725 [Pleurodeles waltl]|uniref:Uncharacterized protein n=1 Tax=Pleurodeles waltl TaxID=8319 RepID=A0AAV7S0I7_PLEWA|nr:hypothetical protein NDU88_009725 [Pleurodeles waltl]
MRTNQPSPEEGETEEDQGSPRGKRVVVRSSQTQGEQRRDGASRTQNGWRSERINAVGEVTVIGITSDRPGREREP